MISANYVQRNNTPVENPNNQGQDKTSSMFAANQPEIHSIFMDVSFFIRRSFYQKVSLLKQIRFCFFFNFYSIFHRICAFQPCSVVWLFLRKCLPSLWYLLVKSVWKNSFTRLMSMCCFHEILLWSLFRTQSKIYNEAFLRKLLVAKKLLIIFAKKLNRRSSIGF